MGRGFGRGAGARRCVGLAFSLILALLTGGVGGVLDTEARHDGVVWGSSGQSPSEGTHRQILPTKRALAQVDAAPSVFTTWGPLGAHIPVGEPVTFHIHARDRDGTLLETFTDAEAFTLSFDGPPGAVLRSTVTSIGGGVFQAQFTANVAGDIIVTLRVLGEAVHASQTTPNPHKVHAMVLPSNLGAFFTLRCESLSYAYGQLDTLTAGEAAQFAVQQTTLEGLPRPVAVTKDDPSFKFEITVSADEEACGGYVLADVCVSSPNDGSALTQTPGSFLESSKTWMYSVDGSHLRRAGRYDVSVSAYDDVDDTWWPVIGSPASFVITPAPASSGSSTLGQPSGSGGLSNPAGLIVTVPVTLLDVYGNQRVPTPGELAVNFVSIPGGAIVVGSVSSDAGTQLTTASVTLTDATRTHTVEARINGELVTGSNAYTLLTVAGRAVPSGSRVSGSGLLSLGRVGETRAISVHLHDSYGNPIGGDVAPTGVTVHITMRRLHVHNATSDNDGGYIDTDVVDVAASFANGKFTASYALDTPDTYGAYVTVRDDGVSPPTSAVFKLLNIRILPGSADAAMTEIAGADATLVAGAAGRLALRLRDAANATVSDASTDTIAVTLTHESGDVVLDTHGNGGVTKVESTDPTENVYAYAPTTAGNYTMEVKVNGVGVALDESVRTVTVKTGPVSALMSVPSGGGIRTGVAGITASFNVTTFDACGNRRFESAGDSVIFVVAHRSEGIGFDTAYDRSIPANTNTSAVVAPFDESTGTYSFSYFTTLAGNVVGELIINGVGVPGLAPFIATIAPGKVDPSRVVVSGEGLDGAVRGGAVAPIRILARDAFGNAVSAHEVRFKIFVDPRAPLVTVTQPLPIVDSDSGGLVYAEGGYVVSSKAELRSVRVIVTLGDATLIDASAAVVEPSGRVYTPETSVAIGSGLHRVAAAGEVRTFRIVPRDDKRVALIGGSSMGGNGVDLFPPAAAFRVGVAKLGESRSAEYPEISEGSDPDTGSSFLEVRYSRTEAGAYTIDVDACVWDFNASACDESVPRAGLTIKRSEFDDEAPKSSIQITVHPGHSDHSTSYASLRGSPLVPVPVGTAVNVELRGFDRDGNAQSYDARYPRDDWRVVATFRGGNTNDPFTIQSTDPTFDDASGTYGASFATTRAGVYDIAASLLDRTSGAFRSVRFLPDGSNSVTVAPGPVDIAKSHVDAAEASLGGDVGDVVRFTVHAVDVHGNPVSSTDAAAVECAATLAKTDDSGIVISPIDSGTGLPASGPGTRCYHEADTDGSGRLVVEYRAVTVGTYAIAVTLNGGRIGSPSADFRAELRHAPPVAANCFMSDQGSLGSSAVAGDDVYFEITARDAFGNVAVGSDDLVFDVYALASDGSVPNPGSPGTSTPLGDGKYRLGFNVDQGGVYSIHVKLGDELVGSGDFPLRGLRFTDAPVSLAKSYVAGAGLTGAVAGVPTTFTLQLVNSLGKLHDLAAGETLSVGVDLPASSGGFRAVDLISHTKSANQKVGRWTVGYTAYDVQVQGEFYSIRVGIEKDGVVTDIAGSPFQMTLTAGPVSPVNTLVRPNAVLNAFQSSVDVQGTFDVVPRDAYNNLVDHAGYDVGDWSVDVTPNATSAYVKDNGNGVFSPRFSFHSAGVYSIVVKFNNVEIAGSPVAYTAVPAASDYTKFIASGTGVDSNLTADASVTHSFTLTEADSFGNVKDASGALVSKIEESLSMTVRSGAWLHPTYNETVIVPTVSFDSTNKVYVVSYVTTAAGALTVRLEIGGSHVTGSPFHSTVFPGKAEPARCALSGLGLSGAVAGEWQTVEVDARDVHGNVVDTQGIFRMFVKRSDGGFVWTESGDPAPNYEDTPMDPEISVESFQWDAGRGKHVGRYRSNAWNGVGYDLDVAVVLLAIDGNGVDAEIHEGRRTVSVKGSNGPVDSSESTAFGRGLAGGVAGSTLAFTVHLADSDGIKVSAQGMNATGENVTATACRKTSAADDCQPEGTIPEGWGFNCAVLDAGSPDEGSLICSYTPTTAGVFRLRVSVIASDGLTSSILGVGGENTVLIRSGASSGDTTVAVVSGHGAESVFNGGDKVDIRVPYTAGLPITLTVTPRDVFGNSQDYVLVPHDSFTARATVSPDPGYAIVDEFSLTEVDPPSTDDIAAGFVPVYTHSVTFTPTTSGTYEVELAFTNPSMVDGAEAKVTVAFEVDPAGLDAGSAVVSGAGFASGAITQPQTFSVTMHDTYGNPVKVERPGVAISAVFIDRSMDPIATFTAAVAWNTKFARYNAEYSAMTPGTYHANLTLDAGDGRGPRTVSLPSMYVGTVIEAGSVDARKCAVSGVGVGVEPIGAGRPVKFTIHAKDAYGFRITRGGATFHALALGRNGTDVEGKSVRLDSLIDEGDGTYTATYTPKKAGSFSLSVLRAGEELSEAGSPFNVTVVPGSTSAASSKVYGDGMCVARAGREATFRVQAYDALGNKKTDSHDDFRFSVNGADDPSSMTAIGGGVYEGAYVVDRAGPLRVAVSFRGEAVGGSGEGCAVAAGPPASFIVRGPGTGDGDEVAAGADHFVTADAFDEFGNPAAVAEEDGVDAFNLTAVVDGVVKSSRAFTRVTGSTIRSTFTLSEISVNEVTRLVLVDDASNVLFQTPGSGLTVVPGAAHTASTRPSLDAFEARTDFTAGVPSWFTVSVKDVAGNVRFIGSDLAGGAGAWGLLTASQIDASSGDETILCRGADAVMDPLTGAHNLSFTPTVAGIVRVTIKVTSDGSIVYAEAPVAAGPVSASASEIFGNAVDAGAIADRTTHFYVQLRDGLGNPSSLPAGVGLDVTFAALGGVDGSAATSGAATEAEGSPGRWKISFVAGRSSGAADYRASVSVSAAGDGDLIGGAAREFTVRSSGGAMDPSKSVLTDARGDEVSDGLVVRGGVTAPVVFHVQLRDENGVDIDGEVSTLTSSALVAVDVLGVDVDKAGSSVTREWSSGGRVTFTLRTNVAGTYTISAEVCATSGDGVTCDGDWSRARNDGASIVVAPGVPAPGRSVVECGGSIASAVNAPAVCAVTLADSHGNKIIRRDERSVPPTIIARLDPPDGYEPSDPFVGSEPCAVSSEPDGTYVVTCVPTVAGSRALRVYLDPSDVDSPVSNELIGGDAYSIAVTHGAFSADKSTIIPPVKHPAGNALVVKVAARDGWGNSYSGRDLSFTATLKKVFQKVGDEDTFASALATPAGATTDDAGRFVVVFPTSATAVAGEYSVDVFQSPGGARVGSRTRVSIVPGAADGAVSSIRPLSSSASITRAGGLDVTATFGLAIDARDSRGNVITDPAVALNTAVTATVTPPDGVEYLPGLDAVTFERVDASFRTGFIPRVPGKYSVTAVFPGGAVTSPYVVHAHLAPAPVALGARMANSLGSIDVRFDAATDRARDGSLNACAELLSDDSYLALGQGAVCIWSSDTTLTLYTGKDPAVMPRVSGVSAGDWIELRPGVIRSLFGSSHASHGDVPLDPPERPIRVDAHLVGPNVVGACDDAMFTASSSTGAGGRRLTYRFKVTSENDVSKASAKIRAMNASDSELRLDVHDLEPGGVYIVTVQVTNFLGDTSTASVTATKSAAPAPVVAIDGAKIIQTTAGAPLRLSAQARLPSGSCLGQSIEDKVGTRIAYTWTLMEGPSLDFGAGTLAKTSGTPTLFVEPRTLEFGSTYVFRVEARLAADTFHRSHDTVTVVVGVDSIDDPIVLGPSSSPSGSGLELVALNRDPMLPDYSSEYPWTHRWECVVFRGYDDVTGESCTEAIDAHLFVDADRVVVPEGILTADKTDARFQFTYVAAREPTVPDGSGDVSSRRKKSVTKSVLVSATPTLRTRARFTSRTPNVVSPSEQLPLYCDVLGADTETISFRWSIVGKGTDAIERMLEPSVGDDWNSKTVVVAPGGMTAGGYYTFRCDAWHEDTNAKGSAEIGVRVEAPPTGGSAILTKDSPVSPVELVDTMYVLAGGWTDGSDGDVRYQLMSGPASTGESLGSALDLDEESVLVTGIESGAALISFTLPAGTHGLYLRVSDAVGASTTVRVTLSDGVTPARVTAREMREAAGGKRRILSSTSEDAAAMVARAWDRAVGTGDSDAAHAFIRAFSRAFGGDPTEPASCEASANDPAMTALKTRLLTELMALDTGSVPSAGYTQQHACALSAGILDKPGEVSDAAHDAVDAMLVAGKLRWMLEAMDGGERSGDGLGLTLGLTSAAGTCAHAVATRMLTVSRCAGANGDVDESRLRAAHDAIVSIGTLSTRGRVPGQSQVKLGPLGAGPRVYVHSQRATATGIVNGTTPTFDHPAGLVGKTYEQIDASSDVGGGVKYDATGFVGGAFKFAVNASREDTPTDTPIDWFMDPESAGVDVVAFMYDDGWAPFDIVGSMESASGDPGAGVKGAFGKFVWGALGTWVDTAQGRRKRAQVSAIFGLDQSRTLAAKRNLTDPNTYLGARWYDDVEREWTLGDTRQGTGVDVYTSEPTLLLFARDGGAGLGFSFYAESSVASPPLPPSPPPAPPSPPFEVTAADGGGGRRPFLPPIYSPVGLLAAIIGGALALYGAVRFYFKFRSQLFKAAAAKDDDPLLAEEDIDEDDADVGTPRETRRWKEGGWKDLDGSDDEKDLGRTLDAKGKPRSPESPTNDDKYVVADVVVAVEDEYAHDEYM